MKAARLQQLNLSEFMVRSSQIAAEMALEDQTRFVLSPEKWQDFSAALDAPPRKLPGLRRLFEKASVFKAR